MKRVIRIKAKTGYADVEISAVVKTSSLSRNEVDSLCADLASKLMEPLPKVRFLSIPLAWIKVTGA